VADRVPYHSPRSKPPAGLGKRLLWIFVVGLIAAAVISMSTGRTERRPASPPPGPEPMAHMQAKRLQSHAAENAVVAGANAAHKALAAARLAEEENADPNRTMPINTVVEPDRPDLIISVRTGSEASSGKAQPAIRITRIRSNHPQPTREKALNDAMVEAQKLISERLQSLDEPILHYPTLEAVRNTYLRPESVTEIPLKPEDQEALKAAKIDHNRVFVEIDVELSEDQVRELRSAGRVESSGVIVAVAFVLVLALFGFLRLDAWTKGYLTAGIGIAMAAAAGGALALLFLTR
jgi:hypothetical protein